MKIFMESQNIPPWARLSLILSLTVNCLLSLTIFYLLVSENKSSQYSLRRAGINKTDNRNIHWGINQLKSTFSIFKTRQTWTYEQWLEQLSQEAEKVADDAPPHLSILLGDSLSAGFPTQLLPSDRTWLNQGISGETSAGLSKRLSLLNRTQPETTFVMIGINDLLRGVTEDAILDNQRAIIRQWRSLHPQTKLVIQSILPHSADQSTWEGRERLKTVSNERIRQFNKRLKKVAENSGVFYLDLHPLFTDSQGNLMSELTTDGLHLNSQGYLVWRSVLKLLSQSPSKPDS